MSGIDAISMINELRQETFIKTYKHFADDISREIYSYCVMHSLTDDRFWIEKLIGTTDGGQDILRELKCCLNEGNAVLFGTGRWGGQLLEDFSRGWKYAVDNRPKGNSFKGLDVVDYSRFIENYSGEKIVISTRLYYDEIEKQLLDSGIEKNAIINFGGKDDLLAQSQYFDCDYIKPAVNLTEFFLDVGAFDGMSSRNFVKWRGEGKYKVYAFEPDRVNLCKCRQMFNRYKISGEIIDCGCWDSKGSITFLSQGDSESAITDNGDVTIKTDYIDNYSFSSPITFIKMDIEGAEYRALLGAKETIKRDKPRLAISIYHKPEDIFELPQLILSYNSEYRFAMRHYSLSWFDTVLYAF